MRHRTWKILEWGDCPEDAPLYEYPCDCGYAADLPVLGKVIAQLSGGGFVFDPGPHAMPKTIQCRRCGAVLTDEPEDQDVR